jgi:hypothetical protein
MIYDRRIYLFGHCNATEELADLLIWNGLQAVAILDNNSAKYGNCYKDIPIVEPNVILSENPTDTVVCIVARAYDAMAEQLKRIGYKGEIFKLVDYNSFSEYSLSEDTINRKKLRVERGSALLKDMEKQNGASFKIFCPFCALGDIFIMMSYLPLFLKKRHIDRCVIAVVGNACGEVVKLFGNYDVEILSQNNMDEMTQAVLYNDDQNAFIAHQDRPYVVNLHKALYVKCIPLEQIYCCGVFGLSKYTEPYKPVNMKMFNGICHIKKGRTVIFSPYAKSVTALPASLWADIVNSYMARDYQCFTNVSGDEKPLEGTQPISPKLNEIQSLVEYAGTFIGIRSGLCDILKYASCRKIALYPDYNYCDTKWKAIDIYSLEGWENIEVKDDYIWKIP